jgi:hypothetical protein
MAEKSPIKMVGLVLFGVLVVLLFVKGPWKDKEERRVGDPCDVREDGVEAAPAVTLEEVGTYIDRYHKDHQGKRPETLESMAGWREGEWYVYRGGDLPGEAPGEMILAYAKEADEEGYREVLFAGVEKQYIVEGKQVSKEEYFRLLKKLHIQYDPEQTQLINDTLLLQTEGGYKSLTDIIEIRVKRMSEEEFEKAIERDNKLRAQLKLEEKK